MRTHDQLRATVLANQKAGRDTYAGFTLAEFAAYGRRLMFGEHDEAFPSAVVWARAVD